MGQLVRSGAQLKCSFGQAPSALTVVPMGPPVETGRQPAGRIDTTIPMANIAPFGLCMTPTNPEVASATAAAGGTLTPMPCLPIIPAPWTPGALKAKISGVSALTSTCTCLCQWGGVITVVEPGQETVNA